MKYLQERINDLFGTDNNTSATIIITFFIFGIGIFFTWLGSLISNYIKRRNTRKIFNHLVKSLEKPLKKQSEHFRLFAIALDIKNVKNDSLKITPISQLDTIMNLNFNETYIAFLGGFENGFIKGKKENL